VSSSCFEAVVIDVQLESTKGGRSVWRIALDHTEFTAGELGEFEAQSRRGTRLIVPLLRVDVDGAGTLWHVVEKPLTEGTKITARRMS